MRCIIFILIWSFASAAFARVPDVREVQAEALRVHQLDQENLDRWSSRARLSNLVPQITVTADVGQKSVGSEDYRELLAADEDQLLFKTLQSNSGTRQDADWGVRVGLTWKPAGMVFDSAELSAARVERLNSVHRSKLLEEVTFLFFEWRDAQRSAQRAPHEDREKHYDRADFAAARLDALTLGWFRRTLEQGENQ